MTERKRFETREEFQAVILKKTKNAAKDFLIVLKWLGIAVAAGFLIGGVGALFARCLMFVTGMRQQNPWLVWLLPLAGVATVALYRVCRLENRGTSLILVSIRSEEELSPLMAPLIFISTALTHLFGGSAGREGAALQLGGSLGFNLGKLLHLDEKDLHIITMCGMSAAFSALFRTPLACAIFPMEVVSVGVMYYSALLPCVVASLIASFLAGQMGVPATIFSLKGSCLPSLSLSSLIPIILLGAVCGILSMLFCFVLQKGGQEIRNLLKNPFLCAAAGGLLIAVLTLFVGTDYLGAGMDVIQKAVAGNVRPEAFLWKLIFTAVTIGVGFQGGEIIPSFFVGATFGSAFAPLIGLSPSFGAAVGLICVFCGVTNCPITSLLIGLELFGWEGAVFFAAAIAISYMCSGYYGLYSGQKILYSKFKPEYINRNAK